MPDIQEAMNVLNLQFKFCPPPQELLGGGGGQKNLAQTPTFISVYAFA